MKQLLAHIFYNIGHGISQFWDKVFYIPFTYGLYQWLMIRSSELDVNNEIWTDLEEL